MNCSSTTVKTQTRHTCLCGGVVFRERHSRKGYPVARLACDKCGCATLWLLCARNGEESAELNYLWDVQQAKKAEERASAGLSCDIDFLEEAERR